MSLKLKKFRILLLSYLIFMGTVFLNDPVFVGASGSFTSQTSFAIPDCNATIFFVIEGTYGRAVLENNTWVFTDLTFSNSVYLKAFQVSAKDCNLSIYFSELFRGYLKNQDSGLIQYNVSGAGVQQFNFGLSPSFGLNPKYRDLMVRFSSEFFINSTVVNEGEGWQIQSDGTITITGAISGASILYIDFSNQYVDSTLPFYAQHSVTIGAVILLVSIIVVGGVLRFRLQKIKHGGQSL